MLIACALLLGVWGSVKAWNAYQFSKSINDIVMQSGMSSAVGTRATINALRSFINDHSQHLQDEEFYATWRDQPLLARRLAEGGKDKVHLECSTRTALMTLALKAAGFTTRRIDTYNAKDLDSHTFLDVLNPETGAFETHDPDYDITWRDRATLLPVSIAETAADLDQVEPCGRVECGWHVVSREKFKAATLEDYLDFISVKSDTKRYTVYTPRATPTAVYEHDNKRGVFCAVVAENCRDGIFEIREVKR